MDLEKNEANDANQPPKQVSVPGGAVYDQPVGSGYNRENLPPLGSGGHDDTYAQQPSLVTPATRADLATLSGWLKFISIVMLIVTGLSVLQTLYTLSVISSFGRGSGFQSGMQFANFIGYAINIALGIMNLRAGMAYKRFVSSNNPYDLESGFRAQRNFFMFLGIYVIFSLILVVIGIVVIGNTPSLFNSFM
jgi:hypothetical protein